MNIGVIGSGLYKNKEFVIETLEDLIWKAGDTIVSGHSPRNNYDNVDIWGEEWAKENCKLKPIIHPAKEFTEDGFFARNKLIAKDSEWLVCFINQGQYQSGTWNTVKYFIQKDVKYEEHWIVFNEHGMSWHTTDLPKWVKI